MSARFSLLTQCSHPMFFRSLKSPVVVDDESAFVQRSVLKFSVSLWLLFSENINLLSTRTW